MSKHIPQRLKEDPENQPWEKSLKEDDLRLWYGLPLRSKDSTPPRLRDVFRPIFGCSIGINNEWVHISATGKLTRDGDHIYLEPLLLPYIYDFDLSEGDPGPRLSTEELSSPFQGRVEFKAQDEFSPSCESFRDNGSIIRITPYFFKLLIGEGQKAGSEFVFIRNQGWRVSYA